jgi:endonuclease/exonuclease/phosphatase family metal-dependent hydrolase
LDVFVFPNALAPIQSWVFAKTLGTFSLASGRQSQHSHAMMKRVFCWLTFLALFLGFLAVDTFADTIRVATYNLENYLDQPTESRHNPKSAEARAKIRESIKAINPDVLALEEMGTTNALLELRDSLRADGLDFPWWEHISAYDTNIHVAILSKLPITARRPHTNETFLLDGQRMEVKRGFAEVDLAAGTNFSFTLIAAHLKSKLTAANADEATERLEEAKCLRRIIDIRLAAEPAANLIVLGDFNDTHNAASTRAIIGTGRARLIDTRPAERNGDNLPNPNPRYEPMSVTWTHFYGVEDTYQRIDYILLSPAMKKRWVAGETYIPTIANWGIGSDHRPIVAAFQTDTK